jgi:hypothetical protein
MCWAPQYRRQKTKTKKTTPQYVLDTTMHKTKDEDKQSKKKQNMCWTTPYTTQKTKTNKPKNTTQFVLDDTIHKMKD